jgi:hypothetical protein
VFGSRQPSNASHQVSPGTAEAGTFVPPLGIHRRIYNPPRAFDGESTLSGEEMRPVSIERDVILRPGPRRHVTTSEIDISHMEADMALANAQIEESIATVRGEMGRRVEENPKENRRLSRHLESLNWSTPRGSITSSSLRTSVSSQTFRTLRHTLLGSQLANKNFSTLLKTDRQFHSLMNDLNGLREWWDTNRSEWIEKKREMEGLEKALDAIVPRLGRIRSDLNDRSMSGHKRNAKVGERHRLKKQYNRQRESLERFNQWFEERATIMEGVKLRFRQLKLEMARKFASKYVFDPILLHYPLKLLL